MQTAITLTATQPVEYRPVSDLFDQFISWIDRSAKTARTYINNLRQFAAWLRYSNISRPERSDIINYRQWLQTEHPAIELDGSGWAYRLDGNGNRQLVACKPNTAAQYLRTVCQFFKWTAAAGLYPDVASNIHAPKVAQGTHRKEALTAPDVVTIERSIQAASAARVDAAAAAAKDTTGRMQRSTEQGKRLYAMYLLAVNAGLRTIEISRLNVKDMVTNNNQTWLYIQGKGHTEPDQKKALAPAVAAAIRDYLASRNDSYTGKSPMFVSTGNRSGGGRIATTTISTMLKRAMQAAGYDDERLTAHSLRHTAGTAVMEMTGNLYDTQQYMRHVNPATTEIYLHTNTERQDSRTAASLYEYYHKAAANS